MKSYITIMLLACFIIGATALKAQTAENIKRTELAIRNNGKYALLVMNVKHLKAAIITGKDLKQRSLKIDFQIVTCGALVKEISEDKVLQALVVEAVKKNGLKILVCGLSIQQLEVDSTLLPLQTPITNNGLIYMFGLQELGYKTIAL